jgi:Rnl2 family RNA ligase
MKFKKWSSIENHYNSKFINGFLKKCGGQLLNNERFIITEKIDGSNFSVIFYPEGYWQFAKRSGIIVDEPFYDYKVAFQPESKKNFLESVSNYCVKTKKTLQFVGELFGQGVQKRVYYGPDKYWVWYAIYEHIAYNKTNNLNYREILRVVDDIKIEIGFDIMDCFIHVLDEVIGIDKSLEFDINQNSFYTPNNYDKPNLMEGIVIRPMNNYWIDERSMLLIKKKNPNFDDRNKVKKEKKLFNVSEDLQSLYDKVIGYVNENRTADLFSKVGPISSMSQFGEYLGMYSKDIHEDIMKNYPLDFDNLERKEQKWLIKQFTPLIKEELMKEIRSYNYG